MKKIKVLLLLVIMIFPFCVFAYTDGDEPLVSSKVYNFLLDDYNSEDVIRLYNSEEKTIPNYFNLNDYFYEKYNFHIPVANQRNLGLCDTFAPIKSIETNYALKSGKFIDISERYVDFMTSRDFLGKRELGYICENDVCNEGDSSSYNNVTALIQSFGAPLEKELPYVNYSENDYDLFNNSHNILKVNSVVEFPNLQHVENQTVKDEWIKILKVHIMKYGSIRASVCAPSKNIYNSETTSAYQNAVCTAGGHGVSIVGWDDNYSKENFKVTPEHDGAYIILNSWGESWGNHGYYYVSYDDINVLVQLSGVLDVSEARKYNIYSKSSNMFNVDGGWGIPQYGSLYNFTAMKFDRIKENEYLSHIAVSAAYGYSTNNSTKIRFYLNPIDDTFDKEKMIYLGEELPTLAGETTIITLDEPIKITGDKFALVYEVVGDTSRFYYRNAVDKDGNRIHGFTYTSKGWDQPWNLTGNMYTVFPAFVFTIDGIVKNASIKTEPSKKSYIKGQSIDLTGGVLNVTYDDNTTTEIDMTDSAVKVYDYDTSMLDTQRVTILYEGNFLTYNITVKNDMEGIIVNTNPTKTTYTRGESLDLTGGEITAIYEDNSTENILMVDKSVSVTGYNPNTLGNQNITVTYKGKTATFNITVIEQTYTVSFNSDGGSSINPQEVNRNAKAIEPSVPTKTGYTFKEWQLNGNTYDFDTLVTDDITLTALWQINQYTVTFDSNGGSSVPSQLVNYQGVITLVTPTREHYTFKGWQLNGEPYSISDSVTENITLVAIWEKHQHTITFDSNGGSNVPSQLTNYNEKTTKPADPTRNGYRFMGWQLDGSLYDFDTPITGNITLTAVWEVLSGVLSETLQNNSYTVTNNLVTGFTVGKTVQEIKNELGNDIVIETNNSVISTGAVIKKNNESFTVVVKGDLTGDGRINSGDLLQMRKHLLEDVILTGAYKEAGIIESNGNIKSLDLLRLRQYLLGDYTFR